MSDITRGLIGCADEVIYLIEETLDFWDVQTRASILIQPTRFNNKNVKLYAEPFCEGKIY